MGWAAMLRFYSFHQNRRPGAALLVPSGHRSEAEATARQPRAIDDAAKGPERAWPGGPATPGSATPL